MTPDEKNLLLTVARILRAKIRNEIYAEQKDDLWAICDALKSFDAKEGVALNEIYNPMPEFKSIDWYHVTGRGWICVVNCTREEAHLAFGKEIIIDGERYLCTATERFQHSFGAGWQKYGMLIRSPHTNADAH